MDFYHRGDGYWIIARYPPKKHSGSVRNPHKSIWKPTSDKHVADNLSSHLPARATQGNLTVKFNQIINRFPANKFDWWSVMLIMRAVNYAKYLLQFHFQHTHTVVVIMNLGNMCANYKTALGYIRTIWSEKICYNALISLSACICDDVCAHPKLGNFRHVACFSHNWIPIRPSQLFVYVWVSGAV